MEWRGVWKARSAVPSCSNQVAFAGYANRFIKKTDSVLIVGCGDGRLMLRLKGSEFSGLDLNKSLNKTRSLKVTAGDAIQMPFEDKEFDVVILNSVLHYLDGGKELDLALNEAERVSRRVVLLGDLLHPFESSGRYCKFPPGFYKTRGYAVSTQKWNKRFCGVKKV